MTSHGSFGSPARSGRGAVPDGRHRRVVRGPGHRPRARRDDHGLEPGGGAALRLFRRRGARRVDRHAGAAGASRRVGQPAGHRARRGDRPPGRHAADGQGRAPDRRLDLDVADPRRRGQDRRRGRLHARHQHAHRGRGRDAPQRGAARRRAAARGARKLGVGRRVQRGELVAGALPHPRLRPRPLRRQLRGLLRGHSSRRSRAGPSRGGGHHRGRPAGGPRVPGRAARRGRAGHPRPRDDGQGRRRCRSVRMVGTVQDVTGLARTRQRLEQANRQNAGAAQLGRRRHLRARPGGLHHVRQPRRDGPDGSFDRGDARPAPSRARPPQPRGRDPQPGRGLPVHRRARAGRPAHRLRRGLLAQRRVELPRRVHDDADQRGRHRDGSARGIPRHHRAPADRERARAAQLGAGGAGASRPAHRPREPAAARGGPRHLRRAAGPLRPLLLRAAVRPRPLQDAQRPPGPPGGRRRPVRGRRDARAREPHQRRRLPLRRRGAARAAGRAVARGRADRLRADARGGAGARDRARRERDRRRHDQHRRRGLPRGRPAPTRRTPSGAPTARSTPPRRRAATSWSPTPSP